MPREDRVYEYEGIESSCQRYLKRNPDELEHDEFNIDSDDTKDSDESI